MSMERRGESQSVEIGSNIPPIDPTSYGSLTFKVGEVQQFLTDVSDEDAELTTQLAQWLWRSLLHPSNVGAAKQFLLLIEAVLARTLDDKTKERIIGFTRMSDTDPPSLEAIEAASPGELAARARASAIDIGSIPKIVVALEESEAADLPRGLRNQRTRLLGEAALYSAIEELAKARVDELVADARDLETSWAELGRTLGVSGQTVYRKYDADARERHRAYQKEHRKTTRPPSSEEG